MIEWMREPEIVCYSPFLGDRTDREKARRVQKRPGPSGSDCWRFVA
jgi:hypothetical protein